MLGIVSSATEVADFTWKASIHTNSGTWGRIVSLHSSSGTSSNSQEKQAKPSMWKAVYREVKPVSSASVEEKKIAAPETRFEISYAHKLGNCSLDTKKRIRTHTQVHMHALDHCHYYIEVGTFRNWACFKKRAFWKECSHVFFHANEKLVLSEWIFTANLNEWATFKTIFLKTEQNKTKQTSFIY